MDTSGGTQYGSPLYNIQGNLKNVLNSALVSTMRTLNGAAIKFSPKQLQKKKLRQNLILLLLYHPAQKQGYTFYPN
jgi:hypothetical protein